MRAFSIHREGKEKDKKDVKELKRKERNMISRRYNIASTVLSAIKDSPLPNIVYKLSRNVLERLSPPVPMSNQAQQPCQSSFFVQKRKVYFFPKEENYDIKEVNGKTEIISKEEAGV